MTRAERRHRAQRAKAARQRVWYDVWNESRPMHPSLAESLRYCSCWSCKRYQGETPPDRGPQVDEEW